MHSSAACAMNTYSLLHVAQLRETLPGVAHMSFKCSTLGHSTCCHSCCRPWLGTQTIWPSGPVTQFHMFEDTIAPVCLPYAHHTPHTSDLGCACCSLARRCSATPLYVFDASGAGGGRDTHRVGKRFNGTRSAQNGTLRLLPVPALGPTPAPFLRVVGQEETSNRRFRRNRRFRTEPLQ
jgi:hypothetical protein